MRCLLLPDTTRSAAVAEEIGNPCHLTIRYVTQSSVEILKHLHGHGAQSRAF